MFGIMQQKLCKSTTQTNGFGFNYCGTCKSIGTEYGHKSRLFLNYDIVFLSSLLNDLSHEASYSTAYSDKSCWSMPQSQSIPLVFKYTSALNVYLAGIQIRDNINDSKWLHRIKWMCTNTLFWKSMTLAKQTLKDLGFPVKQVEQLVDKNFAVEKERDLSLDQYVSATSQITSIAFKHGATLINAKPNDALKLEEIGSALGKLAYCIDSKVDLEEDTVRNNFNPIRSSQKITVDLLVLNMREQCELMMDHLTGMELSKLIKSNYILRLASLAEGAGANDVVVKKKSNSNCCLECCAESGCECFEQCFCCFFHQSCDNSTSDGSCCSSCCGSENCDCGCDCG